jgi:hypothetical protein
MYITNIYVPIDDVNTDFKKVLTFGVENKECED